MEFTAQDQENKESATNKDRVSRHHKAWTIVVLAV